MTRLCVALGLVALLGATHAACGYCDDPPKVKSGTYTLEGTVTPEYEWLVGSEIVIDRDAGTATLRYEREGVVYEVRFDLEDS